MEKAEIDRDGLDTILSLVQRTAQRDAAVEAVRTGAAAPPPAKRAKRDEPRPEGEDEGACLYGFGTMQDQKKFCGNLTFCEI